MTSFLVKYCEKKEPPHPCDPTPPCDPDEELVGECQKPYLCRERLKNPAGPSEVTRCRTGAFMNVKTCSVPDPDHPCDPKPPCSLKGNRRNCQPPTLCLHRIKNPEIPKRPITLDCDPTK
ncbi:uncharacterized protein LOC142983981 [Anticarsia gemmatalis]|uniref:uncharacterized protein LOC142983981 n=1 Tax=Anticarsia gemmatalis TaxID=129554 RepID=UPI003F771E8D